MEFRKPKTFAEFEEQTRIYSKEAWQNAFDTMSAEHKGYIPVEVYRQFILDYGFNPIGKFTEMPIRDSIKFRILQEDLARETC